MRKLFLDDLRNPPANDWVIARTANEAIEHLKTGEFQMLSLDHDLGEDESVVGNGYHVALWLEELAYNGNWTLVPADIRIHSQNPVGIRNIQAAIDSIDRLRQLRLHVIAPPDIDQSVAVPLPGETDEQLQRRNDIFHAIIDQHKKCKP